MINAGSAAIPIVLAISLVIAALRARKEVAMPPFKKP